MRWFWQKRRTPLVEIPEDARYVCTREGHVLVVPPKSNVVMMPVVKSIAFAPVRITGQVEDPYDIAPAFHMRYEDVKVGTMIDLKALKQNVQMFKLQAKEVVTDPKRVMRRHWHRYMQEKKRQQMINDSFLFLN